MIIDLFTDIASSQRHCKRERICGDTFLYRRTDGGRRSIVALSDGIGHGIKANILSMLTSTIIVNFDYNQNSVHHLAQMLVKCLPVCNNRMVSYSTFSIVDIDVVRGVVNIIEYDNPRSMLFRGGEPLESQWSSMVVREADATNPRGHTIHVTSFNVQEGDRIVVMSDGITQSGVGTDRYPFGWGHRSVKRFIQERIIEDPKISSKELSTIVVSEAIGNDKCFTNDDVTCGVITIRKPERALICSCPPYSELQYDEFIETIEEFVGKKAICGYHLAKLISSLQGNSITKDEMSLDPDVQPAWHMQGVDIVTESLVTLNKVYDMLCYPHSHSTDEGPAYDVYRILMDSDEINFLVGTHRGNGGEYMVDEYELRRKVIKHIALFMEREHHKEINITYL